MDVQLPDGTVIKDVPDGTTKADLVTKLKGNGMAVPAEWLQPAATVSASQKAGAGLMDVPRQVGLTARYGLEGLGKVADVFTEPVRKIVVNPLMRMAGMPGAQSTSDAATSLANLIGLPSPQTADERVVGDAARMVAGAGGMSGLAARGAGIVSGAAQNALQSLAARPAVQSVGAATSGLAGGAVREAGGDDLMQFGASLAGGVGGGIAADKLSISAGTAANAIRTAMTPKPVQLQRADQQINLTMERSGIDWIGVPEAIKQSMRQEVAAAMSNGQPLNADAVRRLLVFQRAGVTPTVGQLTQDPATITREMNLAKAGANSNDPSLQRLAGIQNENVGRLLGRLDQAGAAGAPSAPDAARAAIGSLDATANRATGEIGQLYSAARDSSGRSLPLEGGTFTTRANQLLDEANVGSFLPTDIANKMNAIAGGKYPLTVDVAEQLKTSIGNIQRASADGNVRRALGIVRTALDEAPLQGSARANPGNMPAVAGTVPPSVSAGQESIDAFNAARSANRAWMQRVEANPALRAVVDGVEPDQFVQRFVIGKGATAADVQSLRNELDPAAAASMRDYLVRHLRDAATNSTDDITKFSGAAYRKALGNLGEKVNVFFTPEEVQHLRDLGDAAKYMQAQPAGSAVNNSNSGALLIGKGLDMLSSAAKLPMNAAKAVLSGTLQGYQQGQALAPRNALQTLAAPKPGLRVNPLLAAVAPSEVRSKDDRRN